MALEEVAVEAFQVEVQVANGKHSSTSDHEILSKTERDQITQAVFQAEQTTSGEIVVIIVKKSDFYTGERWRVGIFFSFLAAGVLYCVNPFLDPIWYLMIQVPFLALGYSSARFQKILKIFLSEKLIDEKVHQRAVEAFEKSQLSLLQERSGILIFVSLFEKRAEILADSGIHSRVSENDWNNIIYSLVRSISSRELVPGLCVAVQECGKLLSRHFPIFQNKVNLFPDTVQIEE